MVRTVEDGEGVHEALLRDRRRRNRRDYQNPHLIALLRGQSVVDADVTEPVATPTPTAQPDPTGDRDPGGLTAARGIAYGLLFGSAIWGAVIALIWFLA